MKNKEESNNPEQESEKGEMHFLDHLEEFRWVVIRSLLAFIIGCVVVGVFLSVTADFLAHPLNVAKERIGHADEIRSLVTISPLGAFTVLLQICFLGGIALSLPFVLYFLATFLAPGLTKKERSVLVPGCLMSLFLFLLGASFAYYFILPLSIYVSLQFNAMLGLDVVWSAAEYYSFVVWMVMGIGGSFEFPLILLLLQYVEIVQPSTLRSWRQMVIVVILLSSAIITPSDPISMVILAAPLYILYELSIIVGASVVKKKKLREAQEAAEEC